MSKSIKNPEPSEIILVQENESSTDPGSLLNWTKLTEVLRDFSQVNPQIVESAKIFELITNNSTDLITIYNPDFSIQYISPSVQRVLGYAAFEIIGKKPSEIFRVANKLKPDQTQVLAYKHKHKRDKILLESVIRPVYFNGKIDSYLGISRDVALREHLRIKLESALEKERTINQFKSKFISMASHELKNPLATIASSVELLSMYLEEEDKSKQLKFGKHISRIKTQLERLDGIINEVLLIEKTKAQTAVKAIEEFDLVQFTKEITEESFAEYCPDHISIKFNTSPILIKSSKSLLYHILKNLIENAIKYSKPDQINVQVIIHDLETDIDISVTDEGFGIGSEDSKKLFTQFYRSSNVEKINGFGLGLTIVKECAAILDAKVSFKSVPNKGSSFTVQHPK